MSETNAERTYRIDALVQFSKSYYGIPQALDKAVKAHPVINTLTFLSKISETKAEMFITLTPRECIANFITMARKH